MPLGLTYFKRYRMEIDLTDRDFQAPPPDGYQFIPWRPALLEAHADVKYNSFRTEIDANVFPCLGDRLGCQRLMTEISRKTGFLPQATWIIAHSRWNELQYCGTVQGIRNHKGLGAVQNLGILAEHRGRGLGTCLLFRALAGFQEVGLRQAFLEVTAQNRSAIRLYQRLGFRKTRTVYKAVELAAT